jgi:hypothetical protein
MSSIYFCRLWELIDLIGVLLDCHLGLLTRHRKSGIYHLKGFIMHIFFFTNTEGTQPEEQRYKQHSKCEDEADDLPDHQIRCGSVTDSKDEVGSSK